MNPYLAAMVVVNVDPAHNDGKPYAAAAITAVNADGSVNVRVLYDAAPHRIHRHAPEHLAGIAFHDTSDPAQANKQGLYGAFWPDMPSQGLSEINEKLEKIMTAQQDVDSAVSAIQAVASDITSAAAGIQSEIANLNSELSAAGSATVDTSQLNAAVTALQQAQAAVDALEVPAPAAPAEPAPAEPAPADGGTAGSTVDAGDTGSAA